MSGIVGLFRTDGAPIEQHLIAKMTAALSFRGPDARNIWREGPVAFGHTLLRTTWEAEHEWQPFTIDRQTWIVADARVDARGELADKLGLKVPLNRITDVELLLHAWDRWHEDCVGHLLGDFAFAIWDAPNRRLFCARDQMGVREFFYVQKGPWFIFSNTLECIRQHPAVSDELNDLAIADFLLFGSNQDLATTSLADIQRLPPGHIMAVSAGNISLQRYWSLPVEEPIYYKRAGDYVDQVESLVARAVSDRLRTDRVSIMMSGGLDSTYLAAMAAGLLEKPARVHAFTHVYDSLFPDSERHFAGIAADHLKIPIRYFVNDEDTRWPTRLTPTPEPFALMVQEGTRPSQAAEMAEHSRVALHGEGPDNGLIYEWKSYFKWLSKKRDYFRLALDLASYFRSHRTLPFVKRLPLMRKPPRFSAANLESRFPDWLSPGLTARYALRERWNSPPFITDHEHPTRPWSHSTLRGGNMQQLFDEWEPSYTGAAMEVRHPYFDLRVLRFFLRLPPVPWCRDKHILRCAAQRRLPEAITSRPKTPLEKHPDFERAGRHGMPAVLTELMKLQCFGDWRGIALERPRSMVSCAIQIRFATLSHWLYVMQVRGSTRNCYDNQAGIGNTQGLLSPRGPDVWRSGGTDAAE